MVLPPAGELWLSRELKLSGGEQEYYKIGMPLIPADEEMDGRLRLGAEAVSLSLVE